MDGTLLVSPGNRYPVTHEAGTKTRTVGLFYGYWRHLVSLVVSTAKPHGLREACTEVAKSS